VAARTDGKTIFERDLLRLQKRQVASGSRGDRVCDSYDVTRGGWNSDPGPDTWLTEHVLARFTGRRVRVTIEDLGPSPHTSDRSNNPVAE